MKYLLLIGMLTILPGLLASQSPFEIADTTKQWNSISIGYGAWGVWVCGGTKMNMFCGDTLIAGHNYLKALEKEDTLVDTWEHIGFLREDTLTKQIYFSLNGG